MLELDPPDVGLAPGLEELLLLGSLVIELTKEDGKDASDRIEVNDSSLLSN